MEASEGVVRGNVDSLMKLVAALEAAGIELIGPGGTEHIGRPRSAAARGCRKSEGTPSRQPKAVAKRSKAGASRAAAAGTDRAVSGSR